MDDEYCTIEYKKRDIKEDAVKKLYSNLSKHYVSVGIHKNEGAEVINVHKGKPFTMIHNAVIQELGNTQEVKADRRFKSPYTGKWFFIKEGSRLVIPPRIFIRIFSQDKNKQKELTQVFKQSIELYKQTESIYKNIGDWARLVMKERFFEGKKNWEENTLFTIAYKGSDDPLLITGKMASAIKSEVH